MFVSSLVSSSLEEMNLETEEKVLFLSLLMLTALLLCLTWLGESLGLNEAHVVKL